MYYCPECGLEFANAKKDFETHGLDIPPYEPTYCCPNCNGVSFYEKTTTHCRCCGSKLNNDCKDYCSEACAKKGEKLWIREMKRRKLHVSDPLYVTVREVNLYNLKNGTNYSYGQYVALIKPKRGKKCSQKKKNT